MQTGTLLPLPFADLAEHAGHLDGLEGHLVTVLQITAGSENQPRVSRAKAEAQLISEPCPLWTEVAEVPSDPIFGDFENFQRHLCRVSS